MDSFEGFVKKRKKENVVENGVDETPPPVVGDVIPLISEQPIEISETFKEIIEDLVDKKEIEALFEKGEKLAAEMLGDVEEEVEVEKTFLKKKGRPPGIKKVRNTLKAVEEDLEKEEAATKDVVARINEELKREKEIALLRAELAAAKEKLMGMEVSDAEKRVAEGGEKKEAGSASETGKELAADKSKGKEVAVVAESGGGGRKKDGELIAYDDLLGKAEQIFKEQVFLSGDAGKENNISNIELVKAKGNSFLDGLGNVTAIHHELQIIQAEKEFGFKRTDELRVLNSLRRACELSAGIMERDLGRAIAGYEALVEKMDGGDAEVDITKMAYFRGIIGSCVGEMKALIGSTSSLLQLERKSGSKPWGARSSKPVSINYISGLIESKHREEGGGGMYGEGGGMYGGYGSGGAGREVKKLGLSDVGRLIREMEEELGK